MKILLSSYSVNPYKGSEEGIGWHWTLELAKKFNKPDDRIYLLTKQCNEEDTARGIKEFGLDNVELIISDTPYWLNWYREHNSIFHHFYYTLWHLYALHWVKTCGIKFDIIHHVTMGDFRILSKLYKLKGSHTIFGPVGGGQATPKSLKCYEGRAYIEKFREIINKTRAISPKYKRAIKQFDDVYAINKETAEIMSEAMGKPCKRLFELALADEFKYLDVPEKNNDKKKIVFVGRLIPKKGLMLLLDAINKMDKSIDFVVDIYGDGPLKDQMQSYINDNKLNEIVTLHGNVEHTEISSAYMNGDAFVMPSLRETSGNVIIEAMAHKLPIVALDMSICSEIKEHGTGLFINVNQSKEAIISDMANALTELITNDEKAKALGENGYNYVNTQLSWEEKIKTVYKDFI